MLKIELTPEQWQTIIEEMQERLDAHNGEYDKYIKKSVGHALRYCRAVLPLSYGRMVKKILQLNDSQDWYCLNLFNKDALLQVQHCDAHGNKKKLEYMAMVDIIKLPKGSAVPRFYSLLAGDISFDAYPLEKGETAIIHYVAYNDGELLERCFDLVSARAAYKMYSNIMQNQSGASLALGEFQDLLNYHRLQASRENVSGYLKPTEF